MPNRLLKLVFLLIFIFQSVFMYAATNIIINDSNITNVEAKKVIEEELPNTYLVSGQIEKPEEETPARRFDLVYFIAIPIVFYLTFNIMQIKNQYEKGNLALDNSDWNYIYFNTFVLPFAVAYFDNIYIDNQRKLKEKLSYEKPEIGIYCLIYSARF